MMDQEDFDKLVAEFKARPPEIRCEARADRGSLSGERCGLTADDSGFCWIHR